MPFDVEALVSAYRGNRTMVGRLAKVFSTEAPRQLKELKQAVDQADPALISRRAHTVKGALMNFFYAEAVALAEALEEKGEAGDLAEARQLYSQLEAAVAQMLAALSEFG